jgi:ferredoxin
MTFVITEPCLSAKDASCVEVCPVDCIHDVDALFVIDPEECIDCGACVAECPVQAIYADQELPTGMRRFAELGVLFAGDRDAARERAATFAASP